MKIRNLIKLLSQWDPDANVLIRVDGSIHELDNEDEHDNYNLDATEDYFILAVE